MRVDYTKTFPNAYEAMLGLERAVRESGLEPLLLELVRLRASQLNGCAYCLGMHSQDARALD
jgi:alkylhydroperoxidase family enzyme